MSEKKLPGQDGFSEATIRAIREGKSTLGPPLSEEAEAELARTLGKETAHTVAHVTAPPPEIKIDDGVPEEMIQKMQEQRRKERESTQPPQPGPLTLEKTPKK